MSDEQEFHEDDGFERKDGKVERLIYMIVLMILYSVGSYLLWAVAIAQALWMIFHDRANMQIAEFGARLGVWLKRVAMYQSGTTDEKPFPWREID